MNVQNAKELTIEEGDVRTIHDSDGKQLWGKLAYSTTYTGDTSQTGTPSPDNPVPINVVQGTQTITLTDGEVSKDFSLSLTGKNMLDMTTLADGYVASNGDLAGTHTQGEKRSGYIKVKPNTQYTFSIIQTTSTYPAWFGVGEYTAPASTNFVRRDTNTDTSSTSITFTTDSTTKYVVVSARNMADATEVQLEEGGTTTSYDAYYKPIELCKIGTYLDYIYTDGTEWYIHNTHDKSLVDGTYTWNVNHAKTNYTSYNLSGLTFSKMADNNTLPSGFTEQFTGITPNLAYSSDTTMGFAFTTAGVLRINVPNADFADNTAVKTHFGTSPMLVYYALETPTDTKITDTTLIGQLNAIHEWLTRYGYTATVAGNLPIVITQTNL